MMEKFLLLFFGFLIAIQVSSQTGIGTTTPHASAKLDVYATNKGFLPPRVTLTSATDATTIATPAEGLLVYNLGSVGLQAGYYYWNGANLATIATASSAGNGVTSMDMVKLYSKIYTANSGVSNTTNGQTFTVPVSGRYLFDFSSTAYNNGSFTFIFKIMQGSNLLGADTVTSANNYVHVEYNGKIEANLQAGTTYNLYATTTGVRDGGDYDRVYYKLVAGNLPVTGQSVDYVSVYRTTSQTVNTGDNIVFNTVNSGDIPYNSSTGNFTLTAGKTYRLTGSVSLDGSNAGSSEIDIAWKNAAGDVLGNRALILSTNYSTAAAGNGITDIIYTPTVNTTISLNVVYATANAKTVPNYTYATVEQIGSSAIINPWTLSGTNTYNTNGNVGIGTSAPSASALLDLTSASQGLLPPRVALTAKSGTSSPIASPITGLIVYNTATAGANVDAVTPGYYYFNGTIWTRMDPEGWSTNALISIGATITTPTKGPTSIDYVRYRNIVGKEYEVEYNYLQTSAGTTAGNGDYLISLPSGLQFDFTYPGQVAYTGNAGYDAMKNRIASSSGDLLLSGYHNSVTVIPYNATQFRVHLNNWGSLGWNFFKYGAYTMSADNGFKLNFRIKIP